MDTHNTPPTWSPLPGHPGLSFHALPVLPEAGRLRVSLRIVLESLLRRGDGSTVSDVHGSAFAAWTANGEHVEEIPFVVARVVLQDFTGVPLLTDPKRVEPLVPVDIVVDHLVMVDYYGSAQAIDLNMLLKIRRNRERYAFMRSDCDRKPRDGH